MSRITNCKRGNCKREQSHYGRNYDLEHDTSRLGKKHHNSSNVKSLDKTIYNNDRKQTLNKDLEDLNKHRKSQEYLDVENSRNNHKNVDNKRYLVDKLYIYEHHRVIDLNQNVNVRNKDIYNKNRKDLNSAAYNLRDHELSASDYIDQDKLDYDTYSGSRKHHNVLDSHKTSYDDYGSLNHFNDYNLSHYKNAEADYIWDY